MAATTATAHKIAIIFYTMVKNQIEYDATLWAQRDREREERFKAKLKRQAQRLGYKLVPTGKNQPHKPLPQGSSRGEFLKRIWPSRFFIKNQEEPPLIFQLGSARPQLCPQSRQIRRNHKVGSGVARYQSKCGCRFRTQTRSSYCMWSTNEVVDWSIPVVRCGGLD